jgi:hypothetical protein
MFAVRLSGHARFDGVLGDVAANVFRHLGCASGTVIELVEELNAAVTPGLNGDADLDVQFHAHGESCEVVVFTLSREIWRTTYRIPEVRK